MKRTDDLIERGTKQWLRKQIQKAKRDVKTWPQWMKRSAFFYTASSIRSRLMINAPEQFDIDLGDAHWLQFTYTSTSNNVPCGAIVIHATDKTESGLCEGSIMFAGKGAWIVHSWNPLTLSPSLLCSCGDHGFVRDGGWIRA